MKRKELNRKILAINGGKPIRVKPWLDNFTIGYEEKEAVLRVLESGYLSLFEGSPSLTLETTILVRVN